MRKTFVLFFLICLTVGCSNHKPSPKELVTKYFEAFNTSEFDEILPLITDSITIAEGEYVTSYSHESFYEQFRWDSVFQPTYQIVKLIENNDQIEATIKSGSRRYEFLKNNPLTWSYLISFDSNKITKLEVLEYSDADWTKWQAERDTLVSWIKKHHNELDGFINDLTMKGAINYLKAIELYEKRKLSK